METEEEDEENEEEYSDDDDMSWKVSIASIKTFKNILFTLATFHQVRRCAAKCLEAIISTRPDLLKDFYRTVSPVLIGRFKGTQDFLVIQSWFCPNFVFVFEQNAKKM